MTTDVANDSVAHDAQERTASPSKAERSFHVSLLSGLLMFGPLAFGAVEDWSILTLQLGSATLFLLWAVTQVAHRELRLKKSGLYAPCALLAAVIAIQLFTGRTAYWNATFLNALLWITYGILIFLSTEWLRRKSLRLFGVILSSYGFALALFAIVQDFTNNHRLYWVRVPRYPGWIFGPYVNHNNYAGLMELLTPIPLLLALNRSYSGTKRMLLSFAALLMACSIVLSQSRAGVASLVVELALVGILMAQAGTSRRKVGVVLGSFAIAVVAFLVWFGSSEVWSRVSSVDQATKVEISARAAIHRDGLKMFAQRPWLGWGLGTYEAASPQFRSFYTNDLWNYAHDDYLQELIETGLVGFAALVWFLLTVYASVLRRTGEWRSDAGGSVRVAMLVGITGLLVHSFFDFNLHIPANAAFFFVFCAVCARRDRASRGSRDRHAPVIS